MKPLIGIATDLKRASNTMYLIKEAVGRYSSEAEGALFDLYLILQDLTKELEHHAKVQAREKIKEM